jgi:hypothetical protein
MAGFNYRNFEKGYGRGRVSILNFEVDGVDKPEMIQLTPKEIVLGESLITPGLQTVITFNNAIYVPPGKDFDKFKNKEIKFTLQWEGEDNAKLEETTLKVDKNHKIYRLDNRRFQPMNTGGTEEFTVHACDETLLTDAKKLISKSWKCTKPSEIVEKVLDEIKANNKKVEKAGPARDYIAENIHPFQVIAQQSNVALSEKDNDPSFVHFMTYDDGGNGPTHHFESLKEMCSQDSIHTFEYSDSGLGDKDSGAEGHYGNPKAVMSFSFPCDFDLLSDLLNGINEQGKPSNSGSFFDMALKMMKGVTEGGSGTGIGGEGFNPKMAESNAESSKNRDSCNLDVETHLLKRQARMGLLERDKIALRLVASWNPKLHAGKVITFNWKNKGSSDKDVYGHGDYLILSMTHTIRFGGFSTTTIDCVSTTVGKGEV